MRSNVEVQPSSTDPIGPLAIAGLPRRRELAFNPQGRRRPRLAFLVPVPAGLERQLDVDRLLRRAPAREVALEADEDLGGAVGVDAVCIIAIDAHVVRAGEARWRRIPEAHGRRSCRWGSAPRAAQLVRRHEMLAVGLVSIGLSKFERACIVTTRN